MSTGRTRRGLGGLVVILPFAGLLVSTLVWPQAPDLVPTRWTGVRPETLSAGQLVFSVCLTVAGLAALLAALISAMRRFVPAMLSRWLLTVLGVAGGGAGATYAMACLGTWLAGDPAQVHVLWALASLVLAAGWGVLTYVVHGRSVPPHAELLARIPERDRVRPLRPGEPVVWAAGSGSRLLTGIAVFVFATFGVCVGVMLSTGDPFTATLLGVLGLGLSVFVLAWSRITVRVDQEGLRVHSALLPWCLTDIPPEEVIGVQALDLDPMAWGGYGLRVLPGRTAYVVTGGEGIVVHRTDGRRFAVEVTDGDAAEGARALLRVAGEALSAAGPAR